MPDSIITSNNAVSAAQFMMALDKAAIDEQYQQDAVLWTLNVGNSLEHYLSLLSGKINLEPHDEALPEQLYTSLFALTQYTKNMFHILTHQAKHDLIHYLAKKESSATVNQST